MRCRVSFLLKTYLWTVVVFIVAKVVFMLCCREGHAFTFDDVWDVIRHGLTLDLSTALYFLIVPFLLAIVNIWHTGKWLSKVSTAYFIIIAIAFALAFVADTSLYPFWNYKLDASCLQYLESPNEAMASVSTGYLLVRFVLLILVGYLIHIGYKLQVPSQPSRHRLTETLLALLCIPVIIIGIRGGLGESTTNVGQVYYSQNQFLNHSAVNPVFSFLSSFEKTASYVPDYEFMDEAERAQLMEGLYSTKSIDPDTLLNTRRPDIIIILLESCGGIFTEDIGKRSDITHYLITLRLNLFFLLFMESMIFCYMDLTINPLPEVMNLTHKIRKRYFKKLPTVWKLLTLFFILTQKHLLLLKISILR